MLRGGVPISPPGGGAGLTQQPPSTRQRRHFELSPDLNVLVFRNLHKDKLNDVSSRIIQNAVDSSVIGSLGAAERSRTLSEGVQEELLL